MSPSVRAFCGFLLAAMFLTGGAWWFSPGAGLLVAGTCVAALTALMFVDVGGDGE